MAQPIPNVPNEQATKQALRGVTRGGITPGAVNPPVDNAIMVNAAYTASGILELSVPTSAGTFTISGANGVTTTLTGTSTGSNVNQLISALAAGPLSGYTFYVNAGGANYLYDTTTSIIVPSGVVLTVVSGTGTTPTLTAFTPTGSEGQAYPSYVGAPNATPNWVDDVTVHTPSLGFNGSVVGATQLQPGTTNASTSGVAAAQQQVRQILTGNGPDGGSQTQTYAGYFATYSGNLFQTGQKRTYRQQS